jgi:hypothetical protein
MLSARTVTCALVAALLAFSAPAFASKSVVDLTDDTYNSAVRPAQSPLVADGSRGSRTHEGAAATFWRGCLPSVNPDWVA